MYAFRLSRRFSPLSPFSLPIDVAHDVLFWGVGVELEGCLVGPGPGVEHAGILGGILGTVYVINDALPMRDRGIGDYRTFHREFWGQYT